MSVSLGLAKAEIVAAYSGVVSPAVQDGLGFGELVKVLSVVRSCMLFCKNEIFIVVSLQLIQNWLISELSCLWIHIL